MDSTVVIWVVLGLICLAVIGFIVYRRYSKLKIQGPHGIGIEFEGSNVSSAPSPAITGENIHSRKGGLTADSETGSIEIKGASVERDVELRTRQPGQGQDPNS